MTEREIFIAAAQIMSPSERAAFVDQACGGDQALRDRINGLLAEQDKLGSFLEVPPAAILRSPSGRGAGGEGAATIDLVPPSNENAGMHIGPYKLLQKLGEGGMGTVWVAEQERPVKRRVALKVIKPGMDSAQVIARFEAERQALAIMDHGNIAKVLDAGTTDAGRPYFVMELVKGVPITKYCDELNLPIRERLALFVPVCQAIQHAHQKGIIHRDLKPSNILVAMQDGRPMPKVIDFGVAKALHQPLTEHTMMTEFGAVIGTLEYMSPEQAELSALDIDTRADIYALGVLLYELLTGSTPFDRKRLRSAALDEMLRVIREVEPPRPSTRLTTSENLASLAAHRRTEPRKLGAEIRGELDWIVMKAIEKDRTRRYETASSFARDIENFLTDEPVAACPPSTGYRLRKFVKKHFAALSTAAAFGLVLIIASIVSATHAVRAKRAEAQAKIQRDAATVAAKEAETARNQAESERDRAIKAESEANQERTKAVTEKQRAAQEAAIAKAVKDFLQNRLLHQADHEIQAAALLETGGTTDDIKPNPTIRELLDRAAAELTPDKIEIQFPGLPLVQAEILRTVGDTYRGLIEGEIAITYLERSRDLYVAHLGPDDPQTLSTMNVLALAYMRDRKFSKAIPLQRQLAEMRATILGPNHPDTLTALHDLAHIYRDARRLPESIQLFQEVRDQRIAVLGPEHIDTVQTLHELACSLNDSPGKHAQAIEQFKPVLRWRTENLGPNHPKTLWTLWGLGMAHYRLRQSPQAIELLQQVYDRRIKTLGPHSLITLWSLKDLAYAYRASGNAAHALQLLEEKREQVVSALGADHPSTMRMMEYLGWHYIEAGKYVEAAQTFEQLGEVQNKKHGPDHEHTLSAAVGLGTAYYHLGRAPEAIELLEHARSRLVAKSEADSSIFYATLNHLALAYRAVQKWPQAIEHYQQLLEYQTSKFGLQSAGTRTAMSDLGVVYVNAGQFDKAEALLTEVLQRRREALGENHASTLLSLHNLGWLRQSQQRYSESIDAYRQALNLRRQTLGADHTSTLFTASNLANTYRLAGRPTDAATLYEELLQLHSDKYGSVDPRTLTTMNSLGEAFVYARQLDKAEPLLTEALERRREVLGEKHASTLTSLHNLGWLRDNEKKYADSEAAYQQALDLRSQTLGPDNSATLLTMNNLAALYQKLQKFDQADELYRETIEARRRTLGPDHPFVATAQLQLARNLLRQKKPKEAEAVIRDCLAIRERSEKDKSRIFSAKSMLASALVPQQRFTEAESLLLEAQEGLKVGLSTFPAEAKGYLADTLQRLINLYTAWEKPDEATRWQAVVEQAKPAQQVLEAEK